LLSEKGSDPFWVGCCFLADVFFVHGQVAID